MKYGADEITFLYAKMQIVNLVCTIQVFRKG